MLTYFVFIRILDCGFQVHKASEYNSTLQEVIAWAEALVHYPSDNIIVNLSLKQVSPMPIHPCTVCGVTRQPTQRLCVLGDGLQYCLPVPLFRSWFSH